MKFDINKIVDLINSTLVSIMEIKYYYAKFDLYNENDLNEFYRIEYENSNLDREIIFDLTTGEKKSLNVMIFNSDGELSLSVVNFIEYNKTKEPVSYVDPFPIYDFDFYTSFKEVLKFVNVIFLNELSEVIIGNKIINVPELDLRDNY